MGYVHEAQKVSGGGQVRSLELKGEVRLEREIWGLSAQGHEAGGTPQGLECG